MFCWVCATEINVFSNDTTVCVPYVKYFFLSGWKRQVVILNRHDFLVWYFCAANFFFRKDVCSNFYVWELIFVDRRKNRKDNPQKFLCHTVFHMFIVSRIFTYMILWLRSCSFPTCRFVLIVGECNHVV